MAKLFMALWLVLGGMHSPALAAAEPVEQATELAVRCPVMPERFASGKYSHVYDRRTYSFCCADCLEDFKENPGQYINSSADEGAARKRGSMLVRIGGPLALILLGAGGTGVFLLLGVLTRRARPGFARGMFYLAWLPLAGSLAAQLRLERQQIDDLEHQRAVELAREQFNYAVTHDFGFPPLPAKPPIPPRLRGTYYRGNDERSAQLWTRGTTGRPLSSST